MLKRLVIPFVLSIVVFANIQACYKIPTKSENVEQQNSMLAQINNSLETLSLHKRVHWYLALKDLLFREIFSKSIVDDLITSYKDGRGHSLATRQNWEIAVNYLMSQAKANEFAYKVVEKLETKLSKKLVEECIITEYKIINHIVEEFPKKIDQNFFKEVIQQDLNNVVNNVIMAQAKVFEKDMFFPYPIDYDGLGIASLKAGKF